MPIVGRVVVSREGPSWASVACVGPCVVAATAVATGYRVAPLLALFYVFAHVLLSPCRAGTAAHVLPSLINIYHLHRRVIWAEVRGEGRGRRVWRKNAGKVMEGRDGRIRFACSYSSLYSGFCCVSSCLWWNMPALICGKIEHYFL